jgi:hypothetical protein
MARLIVLADHEITALRTHLGSSGSVEQSVLDRGDLSTVEAERRRLRLWRGSRRSPRHGRKRPALLHHRLPRKPHASLPVNTIAARIRRSHYDAVPIVTVLGEQELATGILTLRFRDGASTVPRGQALERLCDLVRPPRI